MSEPRAEMIAYLESRQREHEEHPGPPGPDRSWWLCLPVSDIDLYTRVYPRPGPSVDELHKTLADALHELMDDEPCRFDHHGNCQEHGVSKPCVMQQARDAMRDYGERMELSGEPEGKGG